MIFVFDNVISAVCFFLPLQKWMSSDLLLLNYIAFSFAHANTVFVTSYSVSEFFFANFLTMYNATSLI